MYVQVLQSFKNALLSKFGTKNKEMYVKMFILEFILRFTFYLFCSGLFVYTLHIFFIYLYSSYYLYDHFFIPTLYIIYT